MSDAFLATFADFRLVKGRKVAQLVFEVPIEQANEALAALGGVPQPAAERWVGIAPVDPKAVQQPPQAQQTPLPDAPTSHDTASDKIARPFNTLPLAQQAALRCGDEKFRAFLKAPTPEAAAIRIRQECGVRSRAEIEGDPTATAQWHKIERDFDMYLRGYR